MGCNYLEKQLARWELSRLRIFRVQVILGGNFPVGVILGGNFLWWDFSGWELSDGNHPLAIFQVGVFILPYKICILQTELMLAIVFEDP